MHTRIEGRRHPEVHPRILQNHLNDNIEANCKICNQSVVLNKMADHMIEAHVPKDISSANGSTTHGDQSSVQAQQGHGNSLVDNAVVALSIAAPRTTVDAQQVLRDLNLETINFDDDVFNVS